MDWKDRAKQLVDEHWGYVSGVVSSATHKELIDADNIAFQKMYLDEIEFHFKTSGVHFYKHCLEDIKAGIIKIDES